MKKILIALIVFILLTSIVYGSEENTEPINIENIIFDQIDEMDIDEIQDMIDIVNKEYEDILPKLTIKQMIIQMSKGEQVLNYKDMFKKLIQFFFRDILVNINKNNENT